MADQLVKEQHSLLLTAFVSIICYWCFLILPYPLVTLYHIPLLDLGKIANYSPIYLAAFVVGYALICGAYIAAYRASAQLADARSMLLVLGAALLFGIILIWVYPIGAADIYDYLFRARLWSVYDYNPHTVAPIQASDDPWYAYVVWVWFASPYGPLWTYLSFALAQLGGNSLLLNLLFFKLLPILCSLISAWFIDDLLRARDMGSTLRGVLLFAWNPLLLFESVVNGHNDIVMMTFVLGALWLYHRRRFTLAVTACLLAALIKIAALVALPVVFVAAMKNIRAGTRPAPTPWRFALATLAVCAAVTILFYVPFWQGLSTLDGLWALNNRFTASLAAIMKLSLESFWGASAAEALTRNFFGLMFLVLYVYLLFTAPTDEHTLHYHLFKVFALFLLLPTLWFQPWYIVWVVALAPLADVHAQRMTIVWSAGALSTYLIFNFLWVWYPDFFGAYNQLVVNIAVVLAWLGPLGLLHLHRARFALAKIRGIRGKKFTG